MLDIASQETKTAEECPGRKLDDLSLESVTFCYFSDKIEARKGGSAALGLSENEEC